MAVVGSSRGGGVPRQPAYQVAAPGPPRPRPPRPDVPRSPEDRGGPLNACVPAGWPVPGEAELRAPHDAADWPALTGAIAADVAEPSSSSPPSTLRQRTAPGRLPFESRDRSCRARPRPLEALRHPRDAGFARPSLELAFARNRDVEDPAWPHACLQALSPSLPRVNRSTLLPERSVLAREARTPWIGLGNAWGSQGGGAFCGAGRLFVLRSRRQCQTVGGCRGRCGPNRPAHALAAVGPPLRTWRRAVRSRSQPLLVVRHGFRIQRGQALLALRMASSLPDRDSHGSPRPRPRPPGAPSRWRGRGSRPGAQPTRARS